MTAKILDGESLARNIRTDLAVQVRKREAEGLRTPCLAVILVGNDPASELYVRLKRRDCRVVGIACELIDLPSDASEDELIGIVTRLNRDPDVDGILIQLPLPPHIRTIRVLELVDPAKDVDGVSPHNLGLLALREPGHRCCTPKGVMTLLELTGERLLGLDACVLGASNHVGRPMCLELLRVGCTVTTAHKYSRDARAHACRADLLISATGKAGLITRDWIKPGALVVDIGIEKQPDGSVRGDVEFDEAAELASWITPVPGGVGPMTRVSILENLMNSVARRHV